MYPPLPWAVDEGDIPAALVDTWYDAYQHDAAIDAIWHGEWPCCHELTTGHYLDCPTYDGGLCDGTCTIANTPTKPRPRPVELYGKAPYCMCLYGLRYVAGVPGTIPLDPFRRSWHRGVWAFRIHPKCPHHGDTR